MICQRREVINQTLKRNQVYRLPLTVGDDFCPRVMLTYDCLPGLFNMEIETIFFGSKIYHKYISYQA